MNLPVDLLHWLAAFAPIAMLLFLMIKRKWGIRAAAPVGLAVTVLTGLCFYRADPELILLQCGKGNMERPSHPADHRHGHSSLPGGGGGGRLPGDPEWNAQVPAQ